MLSYVVTGIDDAGVVSAEQGEIALATARAKLTLINQLLSPIEDRLVKEQPFKEGETELTIERADEAIERLSNSLAESSDERERLQAERNQAIANLQSASSQIVALDQLLQRYALLDRRYETDLQRLDFIAEGSHFIGQLQEVRCPLCDQPMDARHRQHLDGHSNAAAVYQSAKAEAAKILGLRNDLQAAISSLNERKSVRREIQTEAEATLDQINRRIDRDLAPALKATKDRLDMIIARRVQLETIKTDTEQAEGLRTLRLSLENSLVKPASAKKIWAPIDPIVTNKLCKGIEGLLREWRWPGDGRVEFDPKEFDIRVDGKPRQSHGKGVRAILHTAFILGLLRYCVENNMPHPGFVVLDSPLTTFKQGQLATAEDQIDPTIESHFWSSLLSIPPSMQVTIIDNKEPPREVAEQVAYTFFTGPNATKSQRKGFIPT